MSTHDIRHEPKVSPWPLIAVLGLAAMLSGLLVVFVHQVTRPIIAENQRRAEARAISRVVPGAAASRAFVVRDGRMEPAGDGARGEVIHAVYGRDGRLVGIAAKASAQGYADIIHMLFGYDPERQKILGFEVLKMAETPGLGDKIRTDKGFLANFPLDATVEGGRLKHEIVTVKHGRKRHPWEIDAISGATISSRAVGKALNAAAARLLPVIRVNMDVLRKAAPKEPGEERK